MGKRVDGLRVGCGRVKNCLYNGMYECIRAVYGLVLERMA